MKRKAQEVEEAIREALMSAYGIGVAGDSLSLARAAVNVLRAPNNKMLTAAAKAMSPGCRPTEARVSVKAKHAIRYRAMIDVIVAETEFEVRVKSPAEATPPPVSALMGE